MKAPPTFRALADAVGDAIDGQRDAERFLDRLRAEYADADDLCRQVLLAQGWSPDKLRGFCRAIQKRLERGAPDA